MDRQAQDKTSNPADRLAQERIFVTGEADHFFERNRRALTEDRSDDPALRLALQIRPAPQQVVEVGAANGYRVAALIDRVGCTGTAIEPSMTALQDGMDHFPNVHFVQGTARELPLDDACADLVIINFVLHWLDRAVLLRSVAEADRILCDGGHLIVGDFLPPSPTRVRYHHVPDEGIWTYKQDYTAIFTSSLLYTTDATIRFDHATGAPASDATQPFDIAQVALLHKSLAASYPETRLS